MKPDVWCRRRYNATRRMLTPCVCKNNCDRRFAKFLVRRAAMNCPTCNTANRDDAKFCRGCGKRLDVVAPPATPDVSAAPAPSSPPAAPADVPGTATPVEPATTPQAADEATVYAAAPPAQSEAEPTAAKPSSAPASVSVEEVEDIRLAPTQILTPQQMVAHNARRWQQESEAGQEDREQQNAAPSPLNGQGPAQAVGTETSDTMQAPAASQPPTA